MKQAFLLLTLLTCTTYSHTYDFMIPHFKEAYPDTYSVLKQEVREHVNQFLNTTNVSDDELEVTLNIQYAAYQLSNYELEAINKTVSLLLLTTKENLLNATQVGLLQKQLKMQQDLIQKLGQAQLIWQQCISCLDAGNVSIIDFFSQMAQYRMNHIERHFQSSRAHFENIFKESCDAQKAHFDRITLAHNAINKYIQDSGIEKSPTALETMFAQHLDIISRLSGAMSSNGQALTKTSYYLQTVIMNCLYEISIAIDSIYYQELYSKIEQKISRKPRMIFNAAGTVSEEQRMLLPKL